MQSFTYDRARDVPEALAAAAQGAQFFAGGTTMLDLMKLGAMSPTRLVNVGELRRAHGAIDHGPDGLRLGALVRMAELADDPGVQRDYPVLAQSLQLAASPQLRNMASLAGNVLQRTRCNYYRDPSWSACNKRMPGSGCAAVGGSNRHLAVLGVSEHCIAHYPGDFATALVALGATVHLHGAGGERSMSFEDLHRLPGDTPHLETNLKSGELITGFHVPPGPWTRRSLYVKVRDRDSYAFALASAAVALHLEQGVVQEVRIGLGGLAAKPWRAHEAEALLRGRELTEATAQAAASAAFRDAVVHTETAFKPELGRRTLMRALFEAAALEV